MEVCGCVFGGGGGGVLLCRDKTGARYISFACFFFLMITIVIVKVTTFLHGVFLVGQRGVAWFAGPTSQMLPALMPKSLSRTDLTLHSGIKLIMRLIYWIKTAVCQLHHLCPRPPAATPPV